MNDKIKISNAAIDAGIRYLRIDPGMSEAILVQGIFEAMSSAQPAELAEQQVGEVQGSND